ncbi:molybdate ABC transporter substrate-binding protein [Glycomyces xiaoerkulensis]|uniref:molybdate ABC transporter substrate-binding protein n=1 Tax=Glycomyces xiaoerkulensis TaxID=2038139 RepID=UPI000C266318|nr:molybdate ABC transporter substrate-binding protein [Glycomyces xiaoerkulensis]
MKRAAAAVAALTAALTLTACGGDEDGAIHVFAAASLTEAFTEIGEDFERANPDASVVFSFAGSSTLAAQIGEGAPADVFASADAATMDTVVGDGHASEAETFARNRLVIAVPEGNPDGIAGLGDLAGPGLRVAVCAHAVPCGAASQTALEAAGVELTPATYETDVKATLAKLTLGEVDAALVYRSDVQADRDGVDAVAFAEADAAVNDYRVAVLTEAANPDAAEAFVAHLGSEAALETLTAEGFRTP